MTINLGPVEVAARYMETEAPVETVLRAIGIESGHAVREVRKRLTKELDRDRSVASGREAFIRDIRELAGDALGNVSCDQWGVVHDTLTRLAMAHANHAIAMDPDFLEAVPAQELIADGSQYPWPEWWEQAGGSFYDGRMIALKTDPVWLKLSDFGLPFPPFVIGSKAEVRDVLRTECDALGLTCP